MNEEEIKTQELLHFLCIEQWEELGGEPTLEKLDALFLRSPQRFEEAAAKF